MQLPYKTMGLILIRVAISDMVLGVGPKARAGHHEAIARHCQSFPGSGSMAKHSHNFVENYEGLVGFGLNRETNENTIIYYLQKLSDDALMTVMKTRLKDAELEALFNTMSRLLRNHLSEDEYHSLFLKEEH
jgi:hypothetical protein